MYRVFSAFTCSTLQNKEPHCVDLLCLECCLSILLVRRKLRTAAVLVWTKPFIITGMCLASYLLLAPQVGPKGDTARWDACR